jgi:hypothetical protein
MVSVGILLGLILNEVKATLWYASKLSILPEPPVAPKVTEAPAHTAPEVVVVTKGKSKVPTIVAVAPVIAVVLAQPFASAMDVRV